MEKIDIIQWSDNSELFIQSALAPAKDIEITLDTKKKVAVAKVSEDQLSLAIGKDGQNVRLAAKITGWKIDIQTKTGSVLPTQSNDKNLPDEVNKDNNKKNKPNK